MAAHDREARNDVTVAQVLVGVAEPRCLPANQDFALFRLVEIKVYDSSSEVRYMVLPERPAGSEGLSEEELVPLVTREAMTGVAKAKAP